MSRQGLLEDLERRAAEDSPAASRPEGAAGSPRAVCPVSGRRKQSWCRFRSRLLTGRWGCSSKAPRALPAAARCDLWSDVWSWPGRGAGRRHVPHCRAPQASALSLACCTWWACRGAGSAWPPCEGSCPCGPTTPHGYLQAQSQAQLSRGVYAAGEAPPTRARAWRLPQLLTGAWGCRSF